VRATIRYESSAESAIRVDRATKHAEMAQRIFLVNQGVA